jgi:hypothetical protein
MHDDAELLRPRDRARAEHGLAVLASWGLDVDEATAPTPPTDARETGCRVTLGRWGIDAAGCDDVAPREALACMLHEDVGRFLDREDYGGAAREVPFVVARARRLVDPSFRPMLSPNLPPMEHGWSTQASRTCSWGIALMAAVFALGCASWLFGAQRDSVEALLRALGPHAP